MRLVFSTVLLSLAWFAAVNAAVSLLACRALALCRTTTGPKGSPACARRVLLWRLMPFVSAAVVSGVLFAPAHIRLEPRVSDETFGAVVYGLALLAAALLVRSARRVWTILRAEWRLTAWTGRVAALPGPNGILAWEVPGLPGISLAGILRPRVLIGRSALRVLTPAELDVAVAHELAHRRAHDNVKRFVMLCAPDLFGASAAARRLEADWREEAECFADGAAAGADPERAATLASALVKVARLEREGCGTYSAAWSTFHEPGVLACRVRRLVAAGSPEPIERSRVWPSVIAIAALAAGAWIVGAPAALHSLTELAIQTLP